MQDELNDLQYTKPEDPDIVKVTRCKYCMYGDLNHNGQIVICKLYLDKHLKYPDDYCSEGDRDETGKGRSN